MQWWLEYCSGNAHNLPVTEFCLTRCIITVCLCREADVLSASLSLECVQDRICTKPWHLCFFRWLRLNGSQYQFWFTGLLTVSYCNFGIKREVNKQRRIQFQAGPTLEPRANLKRKCLWNEREMVSCKQQAWEQEGRGGGEKSPDRNFKERNHNDDLSCCGCSPFSYSSLSFSLISLSPSKVSPLLSSPQVIYLSRRALR